MTDLLKQKKLPPDLYLLPAVANGLAVWSAQWAQDDWQIQGQSTWGDKLWKDIVEYAQTDCIRVSHVSAHIRRAMEEMGSSNPHLEGEPIITSPLQWLGTKEGVEEGKAAWVADKGVMMQWNPVNIEGRETLTVPVTRPPQATMLTTLTGGTMRATVSSDGMIASHATAKPQWGVSEPLGQESPLPNNTKVIVSAPSRGTKPMSEGNSRMYSTLKKVEASTMESAMEMTPPVVQGTCRFTTLGMSQFTHLQSRTFFPIPPSSSQPKR